MALLLGILLWGLAGEQPALLAPKSAEGPPKRILTSPDPDQPAPPKILSAPTGPTQWPAAEPPTSKSSKTAPATEPWLERQPSTPRQPAAGLTPPGADVQPSTPALSTSRFVEECFYVPPKELLAGRPVTLLEAVSRSSDRQQQLQIVRAYWRAARAVADLCLCAAHQDMLEQLRVGPTDAVLLEAAKASAAAMVSQARVAAVSAQHELAALMRSSVDAPLPLPADAPHAGDYRTYFAEIHATRLASETAKRTNTTIPLRRQAMQHQAAALAAANRAAAGMFEHRTLAQPTVAELLGALQECLRQRQAFAEAVVLYNCDIAEYALAVAGPEVTPQVLVNMLIRSRTTGPSAMEDIRSPVRPAQYQQDLGTPGNLEAIPLGSGQPTSAAEKSSWPAAGADDRTNPLLPPRVPAQSSPDSADDFQPPRVLRSPEATPLYNRESSETAPSGTGKPSPVTAPLAPVEPAAHLQPAPAETTLRRPLLPLAPMLYSALQTVAPTSRAKQLAIALHWDWTLPERVGSPLSLQQAIAKAPAGRRRAAIEAYWTGRQKAAEYQVFVQQLQWLEELSDGVDGNSSAAQWLAAAKQQTQADLRRSHAELVQAQYRLAAVVPSGAAQLPPLPTTTPHAGGYQLRLEMQPPDLVRSRAVLRLAALVPALGDAVCKKADCVVAADAARAKAAESLRSGAGTLPELLGLTRQQTVQTLDFLQALTEYNLAIAEYALAVMPADVPAQTLAASLVAQP